MPRPCLTFGLEVVNCGPDVDAPRAVGAVRGCGLREADEPRSPLSAITTL